MAQPESKLSRDMMKFLRAQGAMVWKNHGGPTMMAGLPDITGVWRGLSIHIETKMPEGRGPTPIQLHRHGQIRAAGGFVTVARSVREVRAWLQTLPAAASRSDPYTGTRRPRKTS